MRFLILLLASIPLLAQAQPEAKPAEAQAKPEEKKPEAAPEAKPEEKKTESPAPTPPAEQLLTGSIDFGYRVLGDVRGNFNSYRSVVNLGEGPKLFGWDLSFQDPKRRWFDRIDTQGNAWGGEPYSTARLNARKFGVYDFTFDYRNIAYFNYLPSYADPTVNIARGQFLNENAFDIRRRHLNTELDLFPGRRIVPYFSYRRDWGAGNGVMDFVGPGNEYPVATQYSDHTSSFQGGVRFECSRFHLTLEQGGIKFGDDQRLTNSVQNFGHVPGFLGRPLYLTALDQRYAIDGSGLFSKVLATAHPWSWLDLYGQYLFSQPKTDVAYNQSNTGQFVVPAQLLFYSGQTEVVSAAAKRPHTSGGFGAELRPWRRLRILESLSTDRLHEGAGGFIADQLLNPSPISSTQAVIADRLVWNYNRQQVDALVDLTSKLTLRGGYRYVWGDAIVRAPGLSQTGPLESSELRQQAGLAGLSFRAAQKLLLNFDFEGGASDRTYFRTSLHDYQQARIRARYQAAASLTFSAYFWVLNNENPSPGISYQYLARNNSFSVAWTPAGGKRLSLMGDYARSSVRSDINYRVPQDGSTERSFYRDNAHTATAAIDVALPAYAGLTPRLSFGGSLFRSAGSRPANYYQPLLRASLPLHKHISWNTEWRWYGFGEQFYLYEGFRAHLFMTGLRLTR